jgi:hypothetical protein
MNEADTEWNRLMCRCRLLHAVFSVPNLEFEIIADSVPAFLRRAAKSTMLRQQEKAIRRSGCDEVLSQRDGARR